MSTSIIILLKFGKNLILWIYLIDRFCISFSAFGWQVTLTFVIGNFIHLVISKFNQVYRKFK